MKFHKDYWPETCSEVTFLPIKTISKKTPVTAVKAILLRDGKILLTKVARGWDIPTGHLEKGETPEQTIQREVFEETGTRLKSSFLVGSLILIKKEKNERNEKYPQKSAIIIFGSTNFIIHQEWEKGFEATERKLVPITALKKLHHHWPPMMQNILDFTLKIVEQDKHIS